jgi:hypothetical protein
MAEISEIFHENYGELAKFLADFPNDRWNEAFWLDRLNFWWDRNPAFSGNLPRGWALREKNKIVGFIGNMPAKFQLFGKETIVCNGTTWRVLPAFRKNSMSLFSKLLDYSKGSILFDNTPASHVIPVLEISGFKPLPGFEGHNKSVLKLSNHTPNKEIFNVKQIIKSDSSFDSLWRRTKRACPNTNVRTSDVIDWYLKDKNQKKIIFGYYKNNKLAGYIILKIEIKNRQKLFECMDLWVEPRDKEKIVKSLINCSIDYAQKNKMSFIIFPHFTEDIGNCLKKLGIFEEALCARKYYFKAEEKILKKITKKNTYFAGFQGDRGLW